MLGGHGRQDRAGLLPLGAAGVWVDHDGIEHLAGGVHHGALHAVTVSRVQAHRGALASGGCQQEILEVGGKHVHGCLVGALFEAHAYVHGGADG